MEWRDFGNITSLITVDFISLLSDGYWAKSVLSDIGQIGSGSLGYWAKSGHKKKGWGT